MIFHFGGKYVAEVLRRPLDELQVAFENAMHDSYFRRITHYATRLIGRPTPLYFVENAQKH